MLQIIINGNMLSKYEINIFIFIIIYNFMYYIIIIYKKTINLDELVL